MLDTRAQSLHNQPIGDSALPPVDFPDHFGRSIVMLTCAGALAILELVRPSETIGRRGQPILSCGRKNDLNFLKNLNSQPPWNLKNFFKKVPQKLNPLTPASFLTAPEAASSKHRNVLFAHEPVV